MKSTNRHILTSAICLMYAADTATATASAPATGTKPQVPGTAPTPDAPKAKPEPTVHPKLLAAIKGYDEHVQQAESYYVEMIELIQVNKIARADVVATLMKARGITFEGAQSQYSRMKNIWQDPTILAKLKSGEITLKMAREATTKKQNNPAAGNAVAGTGEAGEGGGATASKETKEARYSRAQKALVAAVKENGFDKKSAILSFEAELTAAGIK